VRILGVAIPPKHARFLRFRISEFSHWPRQSFLVIGKKLYVRAWRLEQPDRLITLLGGGELHIDQFSDLRIWKPVSLARRFRGARVILSAPPWGQYGNRIVQAAVGIAVAERASAAHFILRSQDFPLPKDHVSLGGKGLHLLVSRSSGWKVELPEGAIVPPGIVIEANWLRSQSVFQSKADIALGYTALREASILETTENKTASPSPDTLVIHFRASDQIGQAWRPPPLAYFEKAVEHSGATQVLIVTDEIDNSLLQELVLRIERKRVGVTIQSNTLENDRLTILQAETLCLGIGSFSSGLAGISPSLRVAYSWSQPDWHLWTHFHGSFEMRPDIQNFYVFDPQGHYVLPFQQNHKLTPQEIVDHMSTYPLEALGIGSRLPVWSDEV
jgi:hypothetical protein